MVVAVAVFVPVDNLPSAFARILVITATVGTATVGGLVVVVATTGRAAFGAFHAVGAIPVVEGVVAVVVVVAITHAAVAAYWGPAVDDMVMLPPTLGRFSLPFVVCPASLR
jgi:hypothetical protein